MDDIIPKELKIDFIKIDVEGAELQVLRGARQIIKTYQPIIVFEHGPESAKMFNTSSEDIFNFLTIECRLSLSTMKRWLECEEPYSKSQFLEEANSGKEFYFIAFHKCVC